MKRDWFKQMIFSLVGTCVVFFCTSMPVSASNVRGLKHGVVKITAHMNGQSKVGTGIVVR